MDANFQFDIRVGAQKSGGSPRDDHPFNLAKRRAIVAGFRAMKPLTLLIAFVSSALMLCLLPACGKSHGNNGKSIADLVKFLGEKSVVVSEQNQMLAPLIGASSGSGMKISGEVIEVYKFDADVPAQKSLLEKYRSGGFEVMGEKQPVIVNGSFMLLVDEKHPAWEKIKSAFLVF